MDKMLDGNSAAELAHDNGEPSPYLDQAREELTEKAWDSLTFDSVLGALAEMDEGDQGAFVKWVKNSQAVLLYGMVSSRTLLYITPSDEEIERRAAEIEAENDWARYSDV